MTSTEQAPPPRQPLLVLAHGEVPATTQAAEKIDTRDERSPDSAEARISHETPFTSIVPSDADWSEHFKAERVSGTMVVFDPAIERGWVHQRHVAQRGAVPASTFKIANSIIALELGIVESTESVLPWDGERRWHPDWNMDHSMRSAFPVSAVPFYQELARRTGSERMHLWVSQLEYGNKDITGEIDWFWLNGELRITAYQQLDFLQRLNDAHLPITPRTRRALREIMVVGKRGERVLRAKSGSAEPLGEDPAVNWFVGWVERDDHAVYFATLLLDAERGWASSKLVSDRVLSSLGYW